MDLVIDTIWPSTNVTPGELGKEGWVGNKIIEFLSEQLAKKEAAPP
jgi:hypothetical protein